MQALLATDARQLSWALYGVFFGYPPCCIREFVTDFKRTNRKLRGTGYIPCKKCNKTYTEQQLARRIALHRNCSIPFPDRNPGLPRFEEARVDRLRNKWATVGLPFTHKRLNSLLGVKK